MNPTMRRAVVAVLLPREHLPFIREWCAHHVATGWEIFLYDNTGSTGSLRRTSGYFQKRWHGEHRDKRGNAYGAYTSHLSDADVSAALREAVAGLPVTIVPWQPRDPQGRIVYGQVEAYVDFIVRQRDSIAWAAFIDADEYLHHAEGLDWTVLIDTMKAAGSKRALIGGVVYESRWTREGQPRERALLRCCGAQHQAAKNLVRLDEVTRADVHWNWTVRDPHLVTRPDRSLFFFRHYCARDYTFKIETRDPVPVQPDESIAVPAPVAELEAAAQAG